MDQIYRRATIVSVWLGLPQLPDWISYTGEPILTIEDEGFDWQDSMADIANRAYWSRMWVIQETLVASDVHLYCGNNCIDWLHFKNILETFVERDLLYSENIDALSRSSISTQYKALPLVVARHPDRHPEVFHPLHDLLLNHSRSECKDPRDRVFALLSLIPIDERRILSSCLPNYAFNHQEVVLVVLSYFAEFGGHDLKSEPDDLFLALGLRSHKQRRQLTHAAERFIYPLDHPPFFEPADSPNMSCSASAERDRLLVPATLDLPDDRPISSDLWPDFGDDHLHSANWRGSRRWSQWLIKWLWRIVAWTSTAFAIAWLVVYLRNPKAGWLESAKAVCAWVVRKIRQTLNT